jgi:tRNA1(Val) A37 N6-methylase TrmN6
MRDKESLTSAELAEIAAKTIEHYNLNADSFFEGTRDHDVSQNIAALLKAIAGVGPHHILDFGCGNGVVSQLILEKKSNLKITGTDLKNRNCKIDKRSI